MAFHPPTKFIVPREVGFDIYQSFEDLCAHCPQGTLFYRPGMHAWGHIITDASWIRVEEAKVPKKHRALILLIG